MVEIPNMIMIGSGGRNVGKTFVAVDMVRRFKNDAPRTGCRVIALKVTGIEKLNGICPRGGEGCGACAISGDFCLSEETSLCSGKDTSLLLAAGADKVFWLRCLRQAFETGIAAFIAGIQVESGYADSAKKTIIVCESNSLRNAVEPALFVMINNNEKPKASAADVAPKADISLKYPLSKEDLDLLYALARERCA